MKKAEKHSFPRFLKQKISKSMRVRYLFFLEVFFFATLTFFFEADFFTATSAPPFPMKWTILIHDALFFDDCRH